MRFKYQIINESIPQEQREKINSKIEYIINNNLPESVTGISKVDIFNAYTGKGGLHGLSYSDYGNYYDYQKAKSDIEQGQFFTPYQVAGFIYDCLQVSSDDLVADLTCGHGAFISCCPNEPNFYGCEIDTPAFSVAKYLYPESKIDNNDIRFYNPGITFDYIVGNPPFNISWNKDGNNYSSEVFYCLRAADLLKPAGIMAIVVPESFCEDDFAERSKIELINEHFNFICQVRLNGDTFKHLGVADYRTKIIFMQKKSENIAENPYKVGEYVFGDCEYIYRNYLKPINEQRKSVKQKIFFEIVRGNQEDAEWWRKVEKILYDIRRNAIVGKRYAECVEYVGRFRNQKKPDYMNFEEWEKEKLTPAKVMKYLKSVLAAQNAKKNQENRIIKDNYNVRYNAFSASINDLILGERDDLAACFMMEDKGIQKLVKRKRKGYALQSCKFADMEPDKNISRWLRRFKLESDDETIRLNDMQKHDINLMIQKKYGLIQWEQGSGKTLAGIAIGKYRLENNNVKNVFVISTAISIKNNWNDVLEQFNIKFRTISSLGDIQQIQDGEFVTVTLNILQKYYKSFKKFMKMKCGKVALVFDESDSISNMDSKRTKAVLAVFRRVAYKTLMTGTSTRNNIAEIYPQLELLYNNSVNMISESLDIKTRNRDGELEEGKNVYYMKPFPAYKKGFKLFTASHIPEKITVFGASQFIQDVLNADKLKDIIDKTIITRTFEEVTGKALYEIKQVTCEMGEEEKRVYNMAIKEFYKLEYLFKKTGNSRKDSMLKILNQLLTLLKACAAPQTFKEYDKDIVPQKFRAVISLLKKWSGERVAIGVRHIEVANAYASAIKKAFPNRKVFILTGQSDTLSQRKKAVAELKKYSNAILISTQQALSASMNIDFIDKCIIPELHWNNASMSQYYFRFIRYTSTNFKTVVFVTYKNSIEANLLKMVLVKDKLNLFMKSQDLTDEEVYDRFGIDFSMLQNLMYKVKTEEGYELRWGNQQIS